MIEDSAGSEDLLEEKLTLRKSTTSISDKTNKGFCAVVCGRQYRRVSIVCILINFFNQYSGISPVVMFCPRLIKQFNEGSEGENSFPFSPIVGSIIITAVSLMACVAGFWSIQKFGRKTLFVWG